MAQSPQLRYGKDPYKFLSQLRYGKDPYKFLQVQQSQQSQQPQYLRTSVPQHLRIL